MPRVARSVQSQSQFVKMLERFSREVSGKLASAKQTLVDLEKTEKAMPKPEPKKRGRPPKAKSAADAPKKKGKPAKPAVAAGAPKGRGRPPKAK